MPLGPPKDSPPPRGYWIARSGRAMTRDFAQLFNALPLRCLSARAKSTRRAFRPRGMRGWRAEKRKPMVSRSLWDRAGASRRASRGDLAAPGRAFAVSVPLARLFFLFCSSLVRERGTDRVGIDLTVVSQLLAGPRNGHGRSPDAARVPASRRADPRALHPVPPHDAS